MKYHVQIRIACDANLVALTRIRQTFGLGVKGAMRLIAEGITCNTMDDALEEAYTLASALNDSARVAIVVVNQA